MPFTCQNPHLWYFNMATKPVGHSQRERPAELRQTIQSKITDLLLQPNMAPQFPTGASMLEASATDMWEVTQSISEIKLHNSRDKPRILAASRNATNLEHEGSRIFIHQDLSNAVQLKCCSYSDVVQKLIDKEIRFTMRFLARLMVQRNGMERRPRSTDL